MKKIPVLLIFFFMLSCSKDKIHPYTFYYWKTTLKLNNLEKNALQKANSPFLYTRFFDVDKIDGKFQPIAVAVKDTTFTTDKTIVPVVFITNRVFLSIAEEEIPFLAQQVHRLIQKKTGEFGVKESKEIQIDCDWTAGTKADYFHFLKELKAVSGKDITSTLRLHQVKDLKKMGVPPVSKVYLMCYSTSSPLENDNKNSILDVSILKNYLSTLQAYPIKNIEVALPLFSWGIITNHLGKHKLVNALSVSDLELPGLKKISETEAIVEKNGFYFGFFFNKGFKIKIEEISQKQLKEVAHFLDRKLSDYTIVYYQLNAKFVENKNL